MNAHRKLDGVDLHYELTGPDTGLPLVLSNSLGCTLDMWDPLLPHLPDGSAHPAL